MKRLVLLRSLLSAPLMWAQNASADFENEIAAVVAGPQVTVVHFWAPWGPNCRAEMRPDGWAKFVSANPKVQVVFIPCGSDTSKLASAWLGSGTGLWPVGPGEHGRDARATEESITDQRHGWLGFNASGLAPGLFTNFWHNGEDPVPKLAAAGLGSQSNLKLLTHPNPSRTAADRVNAFLGLPIPWLPSTRVFRDGKLRVAFNYGEIRLTVLQQMVDDATNKWPH